MQVTSLELCQVLLVDDSNYPAWLVLVPRQNGLTVRGRLKGIASAARHTTLLQTMLVLADTQEVIDLPERDQHLLWKEVARACRALQVIFTQAQECKLNIASLGNMVRVALQCLDMVRGGCGIADAILSGQVSQLHIHVTLRSPADPAWPGPCYGAVAPKPFLPEARDELLQRLRAVL